MLTSAVFYLMLYNGRILGISGILGGLVEKVFIRKSASPVQLNNDFHWRVSFVLGALIGSCFLYQYMRDTAYGIKNEYESNILLSGSKYSYACAGSLVGLGTRVGFGCTSGHMLCGLSRLSLRSMVATMVFFLSKATEVILAVRKKTIVATMDRNDNRDNPHNM